MLSLQLTISFYHWDFCTFPRSRLDGIGRNESKFEEKFTVTLSLSVQGNSTSRDQPYKINTSSLGIRPPVCCGSSEEFSRILSKTPDKGRSFYGTRFFSGSIFKGRNFLMERNLLRGEVFKLSFVSHLFHPEESKAKE